MKKIFFLTVILAIGLSSMSFAAIKIGVMGNIVPNYIYNSPILVITPDNLKNVDYDVLLSYWNQGNGEDTDANTGMLIGGTWWTGVNGPINYGWTVIYFTQGLAHGTAYPEDKITDNNETVTELMFTMKTQIVQALDLRADVEIIESVSGRYDDTDLSNANSTLGRMQLSFQYNFSI